VVLADITCRGFKKALEFGDAKERPPGGTGRPKQTTLNESVKRRRRNTEHLGSLAPHHGQSDTRLAATCALQRRELHAGNLARIG
jgi:hypothetical protein